MRAKTFLPVWLLLLFVFNKSMERNLRTPMFCNHGATTYKYPSDTIRFKAILFKTVAV